MVKIIIVLRRNPENLSAEEKAILQDQYGKNVQFIRTDPTDYLQHHADCVQLNPLAVLLPCEKPIPSTAMENGFAHIMFLPPGSGGSLGQLESIPVHFKILREML